MATHTNRDFIKNSSPIFVLGITKRSGSTHLADILCHHPDCYGPGPIWEDSLFEHAELLRWYIQSTYHRFNPKWRVDEVIGPHALLAQHLGDGLKAFLNEQLFRQDKPPLDLSPTARLVTRTPSVENLPLIPMFLPDSPLLIIIRDGRAVTESTVKSFEKRYEIAMREWHQAAQTILKFQADPPPQLQHYLLVRYEDLVHAPQDEIVRILEYVGLDVDRYDFDTMEALPVRGSSELQVKTNQLHWQPVEKTADFKPTERWHAWTESQHARFNWVAGESQRGLGYDCQPTNSRQVIKNSLLDLFWRPAWPIWRLLRKLKYMFGWQIKEQ